MKYPSEVYTIHKVILNTMGMASDMYLTDSQVSFICSLPNVSREGDYILICGVPVDLNTRKGAMHPILSTLWHYLEYKHKVPYWKVWPQDSEYEK